MAESTAIRWHGGAMSRWWLLPSWLISLLLHAAVAVSLVAWMRSHPVAPVGFSDEPSRELGIVLKSEGTEFENRETVQRDPSEARSDPQPTPDETASVEPISPPVTVPLKAADSPAVPLPFPAMGTGPEFPVTPRSDAQGLIQNAARTSPQATHAQAIPGAAFLGARDTGTRIVFAIDCSASMANYGAMRSAKAALVSSLQSLSDAQQFQIIFYNQQPRLLNIRGSQGELVLATEVNKSLARQQIGGAVPDLGTDHMPALRMALRLTPEVLFFLTDADEPQLSAGELAELQRLNQGRTRIHTIEFGIGGEVNADNFLKRLARQNDGTYRYHDVKRLSTATGVN